MTDKTKQQMKDVWANGADEESRIKYFDDYAIVAVINHAGMVQVGKVYANGTRVTWFPVGHEKLVREMSFELAEVLAEEIKADEAVNNLTDDIDSCFNEEYPEKGGPIMDKNEEIRKIVESGEKSGTTLEGVEFEVKVSGGVRKVKFGDDYFTAIGTKKIRVLGSSKKEFDENSGKKASPKKADKTPVKDKVKKSRSKETLPDKIKKTCEKCGKEFETSKFNPNVTECPDCKPRKGKEPKPAKIEKVCKTCGKTFEVSKFTPNRDECYDCKPGRQKGVSKEVEPRKCEVTGEMFTPSKFNPNATISPEGLTILKDRKNRDKAVNQAVDKALEIEEFDTNDRETLVKEAEGIYEGGTKPYPSILKVLKQNHIPKKEKPAPKAYEAPDEVQEENLKSSDE